MMHAVVSYQVFPATSAAVAAGVTDGFCSSTTTLASSPLLEPPIYSASKSRWSSYLSIYLFDDIVLDPI